jgi:hypothetical protein
MKNRRYAMCNDPEDLEVYTPHKGFCRECGAPYGHEGDGLFMSYDGVCDKRACLESYEAKYEQVMAEGNTNIARENTKFKVVAPTLVQCVPELRYILLQPEEIVEGLGDGFWKTEEGFEFGLTTMVGILQEV